MKNKMLWFVCFLCLALTCGCSASRAKEDKLPPYAAELETCFAETKEVVFEKIGVTDDMVDFDGLSLYQMKTTVPFHGLDFSLGIDFVPDVEIENLPKEPCLFGFRYIASLPLGEEERAVETTQAIVKDFLEIYGPSSDMWTDRITQTKTPVKDLENGQVLLEYWDTTTEAIPEGLEGITFVKVKKIHDFDEDGKELTTYAYSGSTDHQFH